jgi:hypothetical protein
MDENVAALRLADTLLPGGAGFPPFAATAAGGLLLQRLPAGLPARLLAAVASRDTPPADPAAWIEAASRLEAVEPTLFTEFRKQAYLIYYEQPGVIAAIRALGHPYNDAPLPDGYPTAPFDPALDTPRHGRGRWIGTDDVRPVDMMAPGLECLR